MQNTDGANKYSKNLLQNKVYNIYFKIKKMFVIIKNEYLFINVEKITYKIISSLKKYRVII